MKKDSNSKKQCVLCGLDSVADYAPFCSKYCRDRDLINWTSESYRFADTTNIPSKDSNDIDNLDDISRN